VIPLPGAEQKEVVGTAPRVEATYRLELQRTGKFDQPGRYRLLVSFAVGTGQEGRGRDAVSSSPLTIEVRPEPRDLKWSEPVEGLAMSLHTGQRDVRRGGGIGIEMRLRNVRDQGVLAAPWPVREREWEPKFRDTSVPRDSLLRFLSFVLNDEQGQTLDLGPEPELKQVASPRPRSRQKDEPIKPPPALVELRPGQFARLWATPAWQGHRLHHFTSIDGSGTVPAVAGKGGTFGLTVTYEVPPDADFPNNVWRGKLTAVTGQLAVERQEDDRPPLPEALREGRPVTEDQLDLDAIQLLPPSQ
jgi:hypothetical protein